MNRRKVLPEVKGGAEWERERESFMVWNNRVGWKQMVKGDW